MITNQTDWWKNKNLANLSGEQRLPLITKLTLGLHTTNTDVIGNNNNTTKDFFSSELPYADYARKTFILTNGTNTAQIKFGISAETWVGITHLVIYGQCYFNSIFYDKALYTIELDSPIDKDGIIYIPINNLIIGN